MSSRTIDAAFFYVRPETRRKLEEETLSTVILTGGFNGGWNFGDIMQLRGALRWHHARAAGQTLCPVHILKDRLSPEYLARLHQVFATEDWLFYSPERGDARRFASESGLVPLTALIKGPVTLHVYGGGFLNAFWGHAAVTRIELLLAQSTAQRYLMTGQQIAPDYAAVIAEHCQRFHPDIVGCRDQESIAALRRYGIDAQFSGDDALEELLAVAAAPSQPSHAEGPEPSSTFGLYLNSSGYVYSQGRHGNSETNPFDGLDDLLRLLARSFGARAEPVLITAYHSDRPDIRDTMVTLRDSAFASLFHGSTSVDLVDLLVQDRLVEAAARLRGCRLVVTTSYHVAMLTQALERPAFVFAFNEYYRQKKRALAQKHNALAAALAADSQLLAQEARAFMQEQQEERARWLASLETVCAAAPDPARRLARVTASLEHLLSAQAQAGESGAAQQRIRELEAQVHMLTSSASWRATAPLRHLRRAWQHARKGDPRGG